MEFGLLGPIQVLDGQRVVPVPGGRVRALLAALLLRANQVTTVWQLADYLGERSSGTLGPAAVQTYMGRLRQALGRDAGARLVRTLPGGYQLTLDEDQLDLTKFRQLVKQAATVDNPTGQAALLTDALRLWRGQPMADLAAESTLHTELPALLEERTQAQERLMEARLRLGAHAELVADLTRLCHEHPLREQFWAQLMLALSRCGRQAEALQAYQTLAYQLNDELGISPSATLQRLHHAVLSGASQLTDDTWRPRCQLPPALGDFVGRQAMLNELDTLLRPAETVPIVAVCGPAGAGKTALAVRAAHRLRPLYPDGQWYVRMTDAGGDPRDPAEILAELLIACGTPASTMPAGLESRAAALRAVLTDRRVLLLLDDARSVQQVQPLLPGTGGNAVLVTSSYNLAGLIARHGGHSIMLDELDPAEAHLLLVRMLGPQRIDAEPAAVADLVRLCGRLPLPLRVAAANLATRPGKLISSYLAG